MKSYDIRFNQEALRDIESSLEWGFRNWGEKRAIRWVRDLHSIVRKRLSSFPHSCPIAPESFEENQEIRQLIYNRYRVLFVILDDEVRILYVRGPYHKHFD